MTCSADDSYDPATGILTVGLVNVGGNTGTFYTNVTLTVDAILAINSANRPPPGYDTFDQATNKLGIPTVMVGGGTTYTNVYVTVGNIIAVGGKCETPEACGVSLPSSPSIATGSGGSTYAANTKSSCTAGTYYSNGSCISCTAGKYSAAGATSCTSCEAGKYSVAGASTCSTCASGTYSAAGAGSCSSCAAGTTSSAGAGSCSTCAGGAYSVAGSSYCSTCAAGTYSATGAGSCSTCSAGTNSLAGATSCTACTTGTTSTAGASVSSCVLSKTVLVSPASGMPKVPAVADSNTYLYLGTVRNPAQKTVTVGLTGFPGQPLAYAQRLLPGALQQLANATGNNFSIVDLTGLAIPTKSQQNCTTNPANILIVVGDSNYGSLDPTPGDAGNHGVTSNSSSNGVLKCSVIVINADAIWSNLDYDPENKSVGHTLLHELGHSFGLDHPVLGGQVMRNSALVINGKKASDTFTNAYASGDLYGLYQLSQALR